MAQDHNGGNGEHRGGYRGHGNGQGNGGRRYGSGRPGNRGGKGFKPRRDGGHGGYRKFDGEHREGGQGGFRRDGDGERHYRKDFRRDGEGSERREGGYRKDYRHDGDRRGGYRGHGDGERREGGYRKSGGFHKGGFRRDGERDFHRDRRDGDRDFRRDRNAGERGEERREFHGGEERRGYRDNDRRGYRKGGQGGRGGQGGFHKGPRRDGEHGGNPRYQRDDRRDFHRDDRRDERGERRDTRSAEHTERREFTPEEKREYREGKRQEYMARPRRNSDGTMSFPSQNPYTDRRPGEPKMPKGMEWSMLSKDERERLRGLSKEHAENIGLHILAAYTLIDDNPQDALAHAKWVARQASRIDFARETLAFVAYRIQDYKTALREFRTAFRMNGYPDYLPFIADCERGLSNPRKAIELAVSDEARMLRGDAKAEMFLVYAGALADLEHWDKAIDIAHTLGRSKGISGGYRMRAVQAEQFFLEEAGRSEEAIALDELLDKLEMQYADVDEDEESDDVIIDHDLERLYGGDDELEELGITEDDAQYAPDDEFDEADDAEDAEDAEDESGETPDEAEVTDDAVEADVAGEDTESADADDETQAAAEAAEDGLDAEHEPAAPEIDDTADSEE